MKKIFRLLLLVLLPLTAVAKDVKLVTIFVGDTNDQKIGKAVGVDANLFKRFVCDLSAAVKPEGVTATMDIMTGRNCSKKNLTKFIDNLSCEGDIVFFVYSGHGGRSVKDSSKFPMMCLGSNYLSEWMYISELNDKLRAKRPRLFVVATNCCNSYYDAPRRRNESDQGGSVKNGNGEGLRELFLNHKGEICITAATPGEYGWSNDVTGGYLTRHIFNVCYDLDTIGSAANWHEYAKIVSDKTYNLSLESFKKKFITNTQRPVYDVKVSRAKFDKSRNEDPDKNKDTDDKKDLKDPNKSDDADKKYKDDNDGDKYNIDDTDRYSDEYSDDVEDELYEDDESMGATTSFFNSLWIALFGILLFKAPRIIGLEDPLSTLLRIAGGAVIAWSVISFFMHL